MDGTPYRINTDYRAGVAYNLMASAGKLTAEDAIRLMYPDGAPGDMDTALEAIQCYLACGDTETGIGAWASAPAYSLSADDDAIVAAFARHYHVDLPRAEMHWWTFRALLGGLVSADLCRRIEYRTADTGKIKDAKLKSHYAEMRQHYALQANGQKQLRPKTLEEYNAWLLSGGRSVDASV